jgi:hypothetical protein
MNDIVHMASIKGIYNRFFFICHLLLYKHPGPDQASVRASPCSAAASMLRVASMRS